MAAKAKQFDALWSGILDDDGECVSGGKVYTYAAGTLTAKDTYTNRDKTLPVAANPIILDAYGRAEVYGDGLYYIVVKDANDVTLWDMDNIEITATNANLFLEGDNLTSSSVNGDINIVPTGSGIIKLDGPSDAVLSTKDTNQDLDLAPNGIGKIYFNKSDTGSTGVNVILDEDTMASDRADALATQQSTKAYVDNTADDLRAELSVIAQQNNFQSFAEVASTDGFPAWLSAGGAGSLVTTLLATTTPFVFKASGVEKTVSVNQTVNITAGFGSNNTLLINEAGWTGSSAQETQAKTFGERANHVVVMNYDNAGTNISGLSVGDKVVFRGVNTAGASEYIYCEMVTVGASGTLRILWRAVQADGVRITFRDNDTWTLVRTNWIFCSTTDGSLSATTVHPVEVDTLPSAGTSGRYILLKSSGQWYYDDGATIATTVKGLIGWSFSHNTSDNGAVGYPIDWGCFGYKFLSMKRSDIQLSIGLDPLSTSKGLIFTGTIQVADRIYRYKQSRINTATVGDRIDSTVDIAAIGIKYVYVSYLTGKLYFSDIMPRKIDEGVYMHPSKMYRCIFFMTHSASAFDPFTYDNGEVLMYGATNITAAITTSFANYPIQSGFFPSFIKKMSLYININRAGGIDGIYSTISLSSTTAYFIDCQGTNPSYFRGIFPLPFVFSGYVRIKSDTDSGSFTLTAFTLGGFEI